MTHSLYHSSVHPFPSMVRPNPTRLRASQPDYRARRAVAAALALTLLAVMVGALVLLAGLGGRPASASQAEPAISQTSHTPAIYVARAGDSLWSIAEAHRGDVGLDRYVDTLIDLNGGTAVQIGQAIRLP
jgi:Tfp pilus assembly protein FimV